MSGNIGNLDRHSALRTLYSIEFEKKSRRTRRERRFVNRSDDCRRRKSIVVEPTTFVSKASTVILHIISWSVLSFAVMTRGNMPRREKDHHTVCCNICIKDTTMGRHIPGIIPLCGFDSLTLWRNAFVIAMVAVVCLSNDTAAFVAKSSAMGTKFIPSPHIKSPKPKQAVLNTTFEFTAPLFVLPTDAETPQSPVGFNSQP